MSRKGHRRMKQRNARRRAEALRATAPDFATMNRTQLRHACRDRGIAYSQMRKDEMIAALSASQFALA